MHQRFAAASRAVFQVRRRTASQGIQRGIDYALVDPAFLRSCSALNKHLKY